MIVAGFGAVAWAGDLSISAQVDRTTVDIGSPVTLTITLKGDLSGVQLPPPELPEGFIIVARNQSTNFSMHAGVTERSTGLAFVLVPQRAGTFKLGPFKVRQQKQELETSTIDITVKKPALPPTIRRQPQGERYTL
ncbi:MAG: BatD family protein [Candidatus Omnitrophica bacterium]|nr:BatD family protein [Candidatus Omnitrophota bacterium]